MYVYILKAETLKYKGKFCLKNKILVCTRYLQKSLGLHKTRFNKNRFRPLATGGCHTRWQRSNGNIFYIYLCATTDTSYSARKPQMTMWTK